MSYEKDKQYLSHHGIVGMHWGQRNGPPYPLGYNAHSASEKKAGWQKSLKGNGRESKKDKTNYGMDPMLATLALNVGVNVGFLALTVGTIAAAGAGSNAMAKHNYKKEEKRRETLKIDKKTGFRLKDREYTPDEDMKKVNPAYSSFANNETTTNCMCCTAAYELRRRGYDVQATQTEKMSSISSFSSMFKDAKVQNISYVDVENKDEVKKAWINARMNANEALAKATVTELAKQGEGARGNLLMAYPIMGGVGHSVAYEVENGKITVRDCQINKKYDAESYLLKVVNAKYIRLDNLDFNKDKIKEAVR